MRGDVVQQDSHAFRTEAVTQKGQPCPPALPISLLFWFWQPHGQLVVHREGAAGSFLMEEAGLSQHIGLFMMPGMGSSPAVWQGKDVLAQLQFYIN